LQTAVIPAIWLAGILQTAVFFGFSVEIVQLRRDAGILKKDKTRLQKDSCLQNSSHVDEIMENGGDNDVF
jgi:hypothetical protein